MLRKQLTVSLFIYHFVAKLLMVLKGRQVVVGYGKFWHTCGYCGIFTCIAIPTATAQHYFSEVAMQRYKQCERFEFTSTNSFLEETVARQNMSLVVENYANFLQLLCSENEVLYKKLAHYEEDRVDKIHEQGSGATYNFCQAEIKLQWAFIHLKFGHEWHAFQNIRHAYKLLKENEKLYPTFLPQQRSLGFLHCMIAAVPEKYQWALSWVGLQGNAEKGIHYLQTVAKSTDFYAQETQFLLALIQTFILKKPEKALQTIEFYELNKKVAENPQNLVHSLALSWLYVKLGKAKQLLEINQALQQERPTLLHMQRCDMLLRSYLYAEGLFLTGNFREAEKYYLLYLSTTTGTLYVKDCYYKLALLYYLQNNMPKAEIYRDFIVEKGATNTTADRYAMRFAEKKQFPSKNLLHIRLLVDGGEYQAALQKLTQFDTFIR